MVEILPTLLLFFVVADFILMLLVIFFAVKVFRIARKYLNNIYKSDMNMYKKLIGTNGISWIERKSDSISDIALWWKLYKMIYHGGDDEITIDNTIRYRFIIYVRLMFSFLVVSLIIAILVLFIGFKLSK